MILQRTAQDGICTIGDLTDDDGTHVCYTLERPWLNNIKGASCIPAGSYVCVLSDHPKHGTVYEVANVPNRTAILIHVGNTAADTEGCVLTGSSIGPGFHSVSASRAAFDAFMAHMAGVASFPLDVRDPT